MQLPTRAESGGKEKRAIGLEVGTPGVDERGTAGRSLGRRSFARRPPTVAQAPRPVPLAVPLVRLAGVGRLRA